MLSRLIVQKIRGAVSQAAQKQSLTRNEKLLSHINRTGVGVEIGPAFRPIAPRSKGYNVTIIDHATRDELVAKYEDQGIDCSAIEEVDYVWRGGSYAELVGKKHCYDWIIASHVIEHSIDFIGFLNDCAAILKPQGRLSLAIPDKRFCFDKYRPKTGLANVIDAHSRGGTKHTEGTVAEYCMNVVKYDGSIAWSSDLVASGKSHTFVHSQEECRNAIRTTREEQTYLDVHAWTFTPSSFRLLINDLHLLGYIELQECASYDTEGHEFFITLGRKTKNIPVDRMQLVQASYEEGY